MPAPAPAPRTAARSPPLAVVDMYGAAVESLRVSVADVLGAGAQPTARPVAQRSQSPPPPAADALVEASFDGDDDVTPAPPVARGSLVPPPRATAFPLGADRASANSFDAESESDGAGAPAHALPQGFAPAPAASLVYGAERRSKGRALGGAYADLVGELSDDFIDADI